MFGILYFSVRKMDGEEDSFDKKITIGVCVMEKKVKCGSEVLFFFVFQFSHYTETAHHCL